MSYKALLFCPDEKAARVVRQVLEELEFTVELAGEVFSTVKRLSDAQFHALVVDCENEQNASLLFKGARNSTLNHSSLYVAVVEGQTGVAKAFRLGANLVLSKPINIDQSKSTLRVARGLLRKGDAKPAAAPARVEPVSQAVKTQAPKAMSAAASLASLAAAPEAASGPATAAAAEQSPGAANFSLIEVEQEPQPVPDPAEAALLESLPAPLPVKPAPVERSLSPQKSAAEPLPRTGTGSAAAAVQPALEKPAAEVKAVAKADDKAIEIKPAMPKLAAPSFASYSQDRPVGDRPRKALRMVAFVFVVGALAYAGWWKRDTLSVMSHLRSLSAPHSSVPQAQPSPDLSAAAERDEKANQPTPALPNPVNQAAPANPGNQATPALPNPENQAAPATATSPADSRAPAEHHVPAPESLEASQVPEPPQPKLTVSPKIQPLEVKTGRRLTAKSDAPAPPALPVSSTAPGNDLSGIVSSGGTPAPILRGTLRVSQGVSQGLLIKKVAPVYPPSALQLRKEGSVELLATVSKTGAIKNISVLSGDPSLAEAAASAVRQWKYRPYLLNSEPVEIETQITIRFRLPN